jgi:hypothetical protein
MQISLDLTEDVIQALNLIPDKDNFVNQLIKSGLQKQYIQNKPSKWATLAQQIEQENYFYAYSEKLKKDMCE